MQVFKHGQLQLLSVSLRNFLSYGNATTIVDLTIPGTTLITGENLDDTTHGQSVNGIGKTTIIQAIVYALYGRAITDIAVDNLVNNINKKNMEVSLDFRIDNMCYRIIRARKMRSGPSGNYVRFYQKEGDFEFDDSDDGAKGHHSRDTDSDILRVIGMKFDLFSRIITFSAMTESFFKLPTRSHGTSKRANQTDFIEELFGMTIISDKAEALKAEQSITAALIKELSTHLDYAQREHDRHHDLIASTTRRVEGFESEKIIDLERIQKQIEKLQSIDIEAEDNAHNQIEVLSQELAVVSARSKEDTSIVRAALRDINKAEKELADLENSTCPYCNQEFHDTHEKIDECKAIIQDATDKISPLEDRIVKDAELTEHLNTQISNLKKIITTTRSELLKTSDKITSLQSEFERVQMSKNPYIELLDELNEVELESLDYTELNKLNQRLDHQKFLMKLLTKRDSFVRKALLQKNLPYLNTKLAENLNDLGLSHKVEFTHELTANITQFGMELDFGNLSNGQQARVNIALSFAFRDVLQAMHRPISLCLLDEVLDVGLDSIGVEAAARMIKKKAKNDNMNMYIISHREEIDGAFDHILKVTMSGRFSSIDQNIESPSA